MCSLILSIVFEEGSDSLPVLWDLNITATKLDCTYRCRNKSTKFMVYSTWYLKLYIPVLTVHRTVQLPQSQPAVLKVHIKYNHSVCLACLFCVLSLRAFTSNALPCSPCRKHSHPLPALSAGCRASIRIYFFNLKKIYKFLNISKVVLKKSTSPLQLCHIVVFCFGLFFFFFVSLSVSLRAHGEARPPRCFPSTAVVKSEICSQRL